jgi:hypothetical protein
LTEGSFRPKFSAAEMPRIAIIGDVAIRVYMHDTARHGRPHFHAVGPDRSMVIGLPQLDALEGDLAPASRRRVMEWARENLDQLVAIWNGCNPQRPLG